MKTIRLLFFVLLFVPVLALAQTDEGHKFLHHQLLSKEKPAQNRPRKLRLAIPLSVRLRMSYEIPEPASPLSTPTPTPEPTPQPEGQNDREGPVNLPVPGTSDLAGDAQSGNVVVNVSENGNKAVKLGLAPRGVAVIDFPADDPVYKIYPGDENFVTVDCLARQDGKCANSPTDAIVLRPGKSFHALGTEESAATVLTIQRRSGIVVSFVVVPVKTIAENANYVVVRYALKDVLEARQKAGLAVNLPTGSTVLPVPLPPPVKADLALPGPQIINAGLNGGSSVESASQNIPPASSSPTEPPDDISRQVVDFLNNAASRQNLRFAKPVQGISLAPALLGQRTGDITIDVVAVRNVLSQPLRLVPEQPELVVENRDQHESGVNLQRLSILHTATTVEADDVLLPGQIYFFAFAYTSPILGVKQALRVSFSHRAAADAPASLDLSISAR